MAYPSGPSYLPEEASFTPDVLPGAGAEDLPDPAGTASLDLDSAPATETHGVIQLPEQPDDLLQEQLPRQIHIQQHLKLHFHPQGKSWRGGQITQTAIILKNRKYYSGLVASNV